MALEDDVTSGSRLHRARRAARVDRFTRNVPGRTSRAEQASQEFQPFFLMQLRQLVEQRLRLFQIERVEAFGEPAVDRSEQFAGLLRLPLIAPEPRHAHRGAQFPRFCLLLTCNRERPVEIFFGFRDVRFRRLQRNFSGHSVNLGLAPRFPCCVHRRYRFANAARGVVEVTEFCICSRQIR